MMTGNGIALADVSKGTLQTNGSVVTSKLVNQTGSGVQKTREYDVNGKRILEVYNDDAGRELAPEYYEITAGNDLVKYAGTAPVRGTHIRTGTAERNSGTFNDSVIHNTVTNKNVTYSEKVEVVDQTKLNAGITDANGNTTVIDKTFDQSAPKLKQEQSVSTGIIGQNEDDTNKYGVEVKKTVADAEGKLTTSSTQITANGIKTTGVVDAADFRVGGVSIVDNIKTEAGNAVEQINEAVKGIDTKLGDSEAKSLAAAKAEDVKTLAAANDYTDKAVASFGSRVNQLNQRIDEVEKTANRGVAIALAAQQAIPNIQPGQIAVFGGIGHYEGESAGAIGVVGALNDRTSLSAALGVAGGSEVGGRVGIAYVFGGK